MARWIVLGVLLVGAVVVGAFAGLNGLVVYLFFAAIAGGLAFAASAGGDWIKGASRGRFDDRDR